MLTGAGGLLIVLDLPALREAEARVEAGNYVLKTGAGGDRACSFLGDQA